MGKSVADDSLELGFTSKRIDAFRKSLFDWFAANGRHDIPWKLKPDGTQPEKEEALNPYGIWVAEVMLQQTQLKVVLPYWEKWMRVFPTLSSLVDSSEQEVLMLWQGLGYYSRARRIRQASKILLASK